MDANVTDGKREISFLKALLRRDIGDAHGAIDSLRQEIAHDGGAPRPSTKVLHPQPILFIHNIYLSSHLSIKFQELPGSGFRAPTSYDLDGWSCVIEVAELKKLLPCGASLTTGVDAPASSRKLTSKATLRYLGTMNNVQVFVPEDKYEGLFRSMIRVTRRVILPSRHRNVSAITNCADLMMAEALVAMEQAGIEHVALRAYGSKASLEARRAPGANGAVDYTIVKSRGYSWVGPVLTNSVRGTVDVAAVWETGESNLFRFRSRSERPTGRIDLFPIGILLQSTREVMNYLTENPDDLSLTGFEHRASETAGTLTLWPSFLRETWRRKLTRAQGKSFPFVVTDLDCQGAKEYFGHGLFMPCGSEVSDGDAAAAAAAAATTKTMTKTSVGFLLPAMMETRTLSTSAEGRSATAECLKFASTTTTSAMLELHLKSENIARLATPEVKKGLLLRKMISNAMQGAFKKC